MKKFLTVLLLAIMGAVAALYIQGYLAGPDLSGMADVICVDPMGQVILAQEKENGAVIYVEDEGGVIREYYPLPDSDMPGRSQPVRLLAKGRKIYGVLREEKPTGGSVTGWKLVCIDRDTAKITARSLDAELFTQVDDLVIQDKSLIICGSLNGQYLAGYSVGSDESPEVPSLCYLHRVMEGETEETTAYVGKTLFIKMVSGRIGKYTSGGYMDIIKGRDALNTGIILKGEDGLWYENLNSRRIEPVSQGAAGGTAVPGEMTLKAGYMVSGKYAVTLGIWENGRKTIIWHKGKHSRKQVEIQPSPEVSFRLAKPYVRGTLALTAGVTLCFFLAWWIYGKNGRISLKLSFLCLLASMALGVLWVCYLKVNGVNLADEKRLLWAGIWAAVLLCVVFSIGVEAITRPLRSFSRYMDRVAAGNYELSKKTRSNDEVSGLWESMNRLCFSLKTRRYEAQKRISACFRFVPRDIHRVFGKNSIEELVAGESRKLWGTVGTLFVLNREDMRQELSDSGYMDLTRNCFSLMDRACLRHGGVQASGEFHMSGSEILFLEKDDGVLPFGVEVLLAGREKREEQKLCPEFFFLVHRTDYLYGLAGTGERVFPFFVSWEIEFLTSFAARFQGLGAGLVMTEDGCRGLHTVCSKRYIGFVTAPGGKKSFKLYEILDACPKEERIQKEALDEKFQEAILQYYKNDFYLARNQFSAIIKEYPGDGIARWYLFACEHYFHLGDTQAADYSLFYPICGAGEDYEIFV